MNYGIFGVMMPLLMEKPTMEYLEDAGISVSAREIKREFKEIIKRQPDIGGYRNNLLMGLYLAAYLAAVYKARSDTVTEEVFENKNIYLFFGKESTGIPKEILKNHLDRCLRIPASSNVRSLNLSNCVALVLYEALRQQDFPDLCKKEPHKGEDWLER